MSNQRDNAAIPATTQSARSEPNRRDVLRLGVAASAALPFASVAANAPTGAASVQRYAQLGRTELEISDISFGSSRLRPGQEDVVRLALDSGINYFDTAEGYTNGQSETVLGEVLKGKRDQVIITSKAKIEADTGQKELMQRLDASLRRLQTDYVTST